MQKLLYITPHLSTGGAPQYLLKKIELLKNDYDISLVEYTDVGGTEFVVQKNKIFDLIPSTNRITLGEDKTQLLDFLDQIQPDIVHLEEIPELFMDREVAEILYDKGRSYLIFETSHDSSQNPEYKQFFPDKFMFVSNWQIEQYKDINVPAVLVEYPIEYKESRNRTAACQRLGLNPNKKHIIHIGLFTPRKNQAEFFEYARALPEYEFHCVGNQAVNFQHYWEPLMQNKPSNLTWWGERNDVDNFYEAADLFLFTSKGNPHDKETMPLVIREALSWKLPIFIYNLEVYQNYFDNYQVQYLNENKEQNTKNIKNMIETGDFNDDLFYTMNGIEKLKLLEYPNSVYDTLIKYGDAAAQYFSTYIYKELEKENFKIQKDSVFVDLGANIGISSRYAKEAGAKEIICFEPDPNLIEIIKKNVPSSTIYRHAVSDVNQTIELYHWPFNSVNTGPKYEVESIDLKKVLQIVNKKIDYLKIDIEGFEQNIFDILSDDELLLLDKVFIEHHDPQTFENFLQKLHSKKFSTHIIFGSGQNYVYATQNTKNIKNMIEGFEPTPEEIPKKEFSIGYDSSEQKIYVNCPKSSPFPLKIIVRDIDSKAVMWKYLADSANTWVIPIPKNVHDYEKDPDVGGFFIEIFKDNELLYTQNIRIKYPTLYKPPIYSSEEPTFINYNEFFVQKIFKSLPINSPKVVLDVGASVGIWTEWVLHQNAHKVYCFEPNKIALKDLYKLHGNNDRVHIIAKALHNTNGEIEFFSSEENSLVSATHKHDGAFFSIPTNTSYKVESITLEKFIQDYNIKNIDLLKIDIEGGEFNVIPNLQQSSFDIIDSFLIEIHPFYFEDGNQKVQQLKDILYNQGYNINQFWNNMIYFSKFK